MAIDFRSIQWIISTVTINRKVDAAGNYPREVIKVVLSFGEKVRDNLGILVKDAYGSELWQEYFIKSYSATHADVVEYLTALAENKVMPEARISLPENLNAEQAGIDTIIMACIYPFCWWMIYTKRWVI